MSRAMLRVFVPSIEPAKVGPEFCLPLRDNLPDAANDLAGSGGFPVYLAKFSIMDPVGCESLGARIDSNLGQPSRSCDLELFANGGAIGAIKLIREELRRLDDAS